MEIKSRAFIGMVLDQRTVSSLVEKKNKLEKTKKELTIMPTLYGGGILYSNCGYREDLLS